MDDSSFIKLFLDRPPINLLRQELRGTGVYLDILQKATYGFEANKEKSSESDKLQDAGSTADSDSSITQESDAEEKFERVAEEKLVSFCEQALREASDLQSSTGETTNMDIHRVLELRAPIIIKVQAYPDRYCAKVLRGNFCVLYVERLGDSFLVFSMLFLCFFYNYYYY